MKLNCNIISMRTLITWGRSYPKTEYISIIEYRTRYSPEFKRYLVAIGNHDNFSPDKNIKYMPSHALALEYVYKYYGVDKSWKLIYSPQKVGD